MRAKKLKKINCPKCGAEYLPCEIFIPKVLVGDFTFIAKDDFGRILVPDDLLVTDTNENYTCDYCNTPFKISATLDYVVTEDNLHNFEEDYKTVISKQTLFLDED